MELRDGRIESVEILGGCQGNLTGISQLVKGQNAEQVIQRLEGTTCGAKATSCPDQLAKALREAIAKEKKQKNIGNA